MLQFITKLQRKPERVRKQIALVGSMAITGIIVLFWLLSLSVRETPTEVTVQSDDGPFKALTEGIGVLVHDTGKMFQEVAGAFSVFSKKTDTAETEAKTSSDE